MKSTKRVSHEDTVIAAVNAEIAKLEVKTVAGIRRVIERVSQEMKYDTFSLAYMYGVA